MTSKVSIVIPTLNEEGNLAHVLPALPNAINEVVIVDGHSTDRTVSLAKILRPDAIIVYQDGRGKGNALKCGLRHVSGDFVILMDADFSHDPMELGTLLAKLLEGYDIAHGSRFLPQGGSSDLTISRSFGNRLLVFLTNMLYGSRYTDLCYGLMAIRKDVFDRITISTDDIVSEAEFFCRAARSRLRVAEIPSYERKRLSGRSTFNGLRIGLKNIMTIVRERLPSAPGPNK